MKLINLLALPMALAAVAMPEDIEARDISLDANALNALDLSLNLDTLDAVNFIGGLINSGTSKTSPLSMYSTNPNPLPGEIQISGSPDSNDERGISKRWDVPGLHCGSVRALKCVGTTAGALNACIWAVILRGKKMQDNAGCAAALTAVGAGLGTDCKLCFGISV